MGVCRPAPRPRVARRLEITYSAPAGAAAQVRDPWNYWVFNVRVNSNFYGEHSYKNNYISGGFSANRITESWKITLSTNQSYQQNDYLVPVYDSTGTLIPEDLSPNITRSTGRDGLVPRAPGGHWSSGVRAPA